MGKGWRKFLQRKLTLIVVPHFHLSSRQINISVFWLVMLCSLFIIFFGWAGVVIVQHIDYLRLKIDNQLLRAKTVYFANEVRQSRIMLDQVKDVEYSLRELLKIPRKEIIATKQIEELEKASGGPDLNDQKILDKLLEGRLSELSHDEIKGNIKNLYAEGNERISGFKEIWSYIKSQREYWLATPNCWPTNGTITSFFGMRKNPLSRNAEFHSGLDIANNRNTPVQATADGKVKLADWEGGYGKLIIIDHGYGISTRYAHNSKILVKPGEKVHRNQIIAYMGCTGSSTGSHLHYEIWKNGHAVNPKKFLHDNLE